jgi:hypothetical protein
VVVDAETGEILDSPGTDVVAVESGQHGQSVTLFGTDNPVDVIERSSEVAKALASLIEDRKLYAVISGRKHVLVEGWTMLGSMLGVFPVMESCHPVQLGEIHGFEAVVSAQTRSGEVIGRASALCMRSERTWAKRDDYALQSMAQTRATSKALRLPLGFVMQIAGYDATPAEEIREMRTAPDYKPMSDVERDLLDKVLAEARVVDPDLWDEDKVVSTARSRFRVSIETLDDLYEHEAKTIIEGALTWIAKQS